MEPSSGECDLDPDSRLIPAVNAANGEWEKGAHSGTGSGKAERMTMTKIGINHENSRPVKSWRIKS
jgi:hypothetical protein